MHIIDTLNEGRSALIKATKVFFQILLTFFVTLPLSVLAAPTKMAVLSGTDTTAISTPNDLNQNTPYAIKWSASNFDTSYFDHSTSSFSHQVTVKVSGDYRLSFTLPLTLNNTSSNRRAILGEVYVNGSPVSIGRMASSYIRQSSGHNESSLHTAILLEGLNANDKVSIYVNQDTSQTGEVTTSGAQLFLEFIDTSRIIFSGTATQTTSSTNLNQATAFSLQWTEKVKDSGFTHTAGSENITLDSAGDYLVFVNIPLESSGCGARIAPRALVRVGGATVTGGVAAQGYMRCAENHEKASLHWAGLVSGVGAGQVLTVQTQAETTNTTNTTVPSGREASIFIERVTTTTDYISLSGVRLLAGTNWNPSPASEVEWDTQDVIDTSTYTHNTGSNSHKVTVDVSGSYYLLYNDHLTSTVQRANPQARVLVNNSVQQTAKCSTHYIRNQNGHIESSCSLTHFLADLQANDEVSIEMAVEAAGGTVNDANPGILTLIRVADADPPSCSGVVECTPDLVLHIDGSDLSSVLDSSARNANDVSFSGTVSTWKDISGSSNIHNLTQINAAEMPAYNTTNQFLTFDGTNDHFDIANHADLNTATSLKERTIVVAFTTGADVTSPQVIYQEGGTVRGMNVYIRGGNMYIGFWNVNNDGDGPQPFTSASTPVSANTNYYASLVIDYSNYTGPTGPDGQLRGHINGVSFGSLGTTTSLLYAHAGAISVGAKIGGTYYDTGASGGNGDYFGGEIFELLIYNHAIDNTEAIDFYNYFVAKWPDPHPMTNVNLTSQYTNDNTTTPNINWTSSISADINRYEVALGTSPGDTSTSAYASVGTATITNITGLSLLECTDYYATVRAIDNDSNISPEESTEFIRYDGTNPTDPSGLVVSGSSSTTTSKVLTWSASTDSCAFSHYEAAIGTTAGASDTVTWTNIGSVLTHQFTGIAPNLATATNYYTTIRAVDLAGNTSNEISSAAWQVDTCVASDVTNPTDPGSFAFTGDGGPTTSPSHTWTASTDACGFSHYELSIGTSAGATDVVSYTNVGNVLTHKFFSISPSLSTNTNYFTNIRAVDLAGNYSNVISTGTWQLPTPGGVSSGLVLWLDASDSSTVFTNAGCSTPAASGNTVECWADKSTSANNATAAGTARPTWQDNQFNNEAIMRFDGTNDALDFTAITDIRTVFIVNKSTGTTYQQLLGHTTSRNFYTPNQVLIGGTISSSHLRTGSWRVDQVDVASPTTFTQTGSYSLISVIAGANVEADHLASDQKTGGRFFGGDVAEVIIYDRALSAGEVTNVETYLNNKWFTANPAAVTGLAFDSQYSALSSQSPNFSWTHSTAPDLSHYEVALGLSAGSNDIAGWTNIGLSNSHQFIGLSLPECTDFFASVRAVDTDTFVSSIESTAFGRYDGTAPSAASSLILSGIASPTESKTLSWSASSDTCSLSHYEVAIGTSAGASDTVTWTNIGNTLSHQFTGIAPNLAYATNYYTSVRAVDSAGNTSTLASSASWQLDSCVASDVTAPTVPSGFSLSGTGTVTRSRSVSWNPSSDVCAFSHYEIGIGTSSGAVDVVGYTNIGNTTSHTFNNLGSNLAYSTNYYLTVRAVDQAGNNSAAASSASWTIYSPGDVSETGLQLWLDSNDSFTLYQNNICTTSVNSDGQSVGCLKDKSGNDNHATNATGSNQPSYAAGSFNTKDSVYFDGATDRFLNFGSTITTIRTVFWVLKEDSSNPGTIPFLLGDPAGSTSDFYRGSTLGPIFSGANASANVLGGTLQQNGVSINGTTTNMPSTEAVLSLVTTGNTTAGAFSRDRTSCCGSRTWGGSLAELIIFDRALSAGEVTNVENYLMAKWGISAGVTEWTGATNTDWNTAGNWSAGVPTSVQDCVITDQANDPVITGITASCANIDIDGGIVTLSNATGATLAVYGNYENTGTLTQNDGALDFRDDGNIATDQTIQSSSTIAQISFTKSAGGTASLVEASTTINDFQIDSGNTFSFNIGNGKTLVLPNGMSMASGTFNVQGGGEVQIGSGQGISVTGGTFMTSGTNDAQPQVTTNKGTITRQTSGRWTFSATAGTVSLTGFLINYLDASGLVISGTADLDALDGGQFSYLDTNYVTPVRALEINTTTSLSESIASNVAFNWGAPNTTHAGTPDPSDNYMLVNALACNGSAIVFDQWFGDFYAGPNNPVTEDKIYDQDDGGSDCQISMSISASPVSLVSFSAIPYDQSAVLLWETGAELNHLGFNVLRSDNLYTGYTQVNPAMILNFNNSTMFRGDYYFEDTNLTNEKTYYYMIEDVAITGEVERHGPIAVIPKGSLGTSPGPSAGDNTTPTPAPISTDLGQGVSLVEQTLGSMRIEIIPGSLTVNDSAWDSNYRDVYLPGYSNTLEPGHPQILNRKILIEVAEPYSSVNISEVVNDTSNQTVALAAKKISPAPAWVLNGSNVLEANYSEDATAYADNNINPATHYSVSTSTVAINGKNYIEIQVMPLRYSAGLNQLFKLDRLVIDIGLDGQVWATTPPSNTEYLVSPAGVEGNVRIKYDKEGLYEFTFDDLVSANVEGALSGVNISDLRLYYHGTEIPIEVIDGGNTIFSSGDIIRFYGKFEENLEDNLDEVVLTQYDLGTIEYAAGDDPGPLRYAPVNNQPAAYPVAAQTVKRVVRVAEQNNTAIFDVPLGGIIDRFYWKRIFTAGGGPINASSRLSSSINLDDLMTNSGNLVKVRIYLRGRGIFAQNPKHSIGLKINAETNYVETKVFQGLDSHILEFEIDSSRFVTGSNIFIIEATGAETNAGDYDLIDINKVEFEYDASMTAVSNNIKIDNHSQGQQVAVDGFTSSNLHVYDVTNSAAPMKYSNFSTDDLGGSNWLIQFDTFPGDSTLGGKDIYIVEDTAFLTPNNFKLSKGLLNHPRDPNLDGDLLIIGASPLVQAAHELIQLRQSQGMTVKAFTIDEIETEFSNGRRSSYAIREFVSFAIENWRTPPKYLFILGDATYDPNNVLGLAASTNTMAIPIEHGQHLDFGSDNFYVSSDESYLPRIPVGRLPTNDPVKIKYYVDKVIAYEGGSRSPIGDFAKKGVFISGGDTVNEGFADMTTNLAVSLKSIEPNFTTTQIHRENYADDASTRTDLIDEFNNGPLFMTYLGHGAESLWGSNDIFSTTHAKALTNTRLPIVMALNCLNSHHYDPDSTIISLGEETVFNPDGGAIAFWGSTSLTSPIAQTNLAMSMYNEMAGKTTDVYKSVRLGDLMLNAKAAQGEESFSKDAVKSWVLFGDPTLNLPKASFSGVAPQAEQSSDGGGGCSASASTGHGEIQWLGVAYEIMFFISVLFFWLLLRLRVIQQRRRSPAYVSADKDFQ